MKQYRLKAIIVRVLRGFRMGKEYITIKGNKDKE